MPPARGEDASARRLVEAPEVSEAIPTIERPVVDRTGVLSHYTVREIEARLLRLRERTGVQMAVLVVDTTGRATIEELSLAAAQKWGGGAKGRDDGVLFVLALGDRNMRLEVGVGLESKIPDAEAARILDAIKPSLRARNYGLAVRLVIDGVSRAITGPSWWSGLIPKRMGFYWLGLLLAALPLGLILLLRKKKGALIGANGAAVTMLILVCLPIIGGVLDRPPAVWFGSGAMVGFYLSVTLHPALRRRFVTPLLVLGVAGLLAWWLANASHSMLFGIYLVLMAFNMIGQVVVWAALASSRAAFISAAGAFWSTSSRSSSSFRSSSSSRSSRSSRSSSSRSSRSSHSSHSSHSSYSGGGGSFGGGGASASW